MKDCNYITIKKEVNMSKISEKVKDKISESTYEKLKELHDLSFMYGEVTYFGKDNIEEAQYGFRYNPKEETVIEDWTGDEYVIIGYDGSIGDGPDPIIIKTDEPELPVYYFATEYEDWKKPNLIAKSLDDYIKIMQMISEYSDDIEESTLSEEDYDDLMKKIKPMSKNVYWENFLEKTRIDYTVE